MLNSFKNTLKKLMVFRYIEKKINCLLSLIVKIKKLNFLFERFLCKILSLFSYNADWWNVTYLKTFSLFSYLIPSYCNQQIFLLHLEDYSYSVVDLSNKVAELPIIYHKSLTLFYNIKIVLNICIKPLSE